VKSYKIKTDGFREYVILNIYKRKSDMHRALNKAGIKHGDCLGLFRPSPSRYDETIRYTADMIGTMYLCEGHLGAKIVPHECLHAAMAHERIINRFEMNYGDGFESLDDEERLAYLLSFYCHEVYEILYSNGHIKDSVK